ncbi:hypothetical protein [Dictyobacter kobayashii]|uniref:Glycosyltransferase RgtA/B/C/D-like domain-containing protein n=1 Tax=Dictyobacter kobayashii TaxID=2014872 RepID=A0A402AIB4_9CHLR|nr:hypothetical protein [Dictyobacter kobayashii]GCE18839.1 hypothetical protein KDK_26390 [Dictyobacter kobayashii]
MPGVHVLKSQKLNIYSLSAAAIIIFAIGLRIILVALNWPPTNSDEGTMAVMASNIAYHGERPLIYYGQDYMGVIEAYLGALFYQISGGPSIVALRLGVILLVGLFFIVAYLLTSFIFSRKIALLTLAILSVGSIPYLTRQTIATGGSAETLLFGTLSLLLAARLAYTYDPQVSRRTRFLRLTGYAAYGLVIGVGVWSDMVMLPILAMATLLLIIFCWREVFIWGGWLVAILMGLIGILPSIIHGNEVGKNIFQVLFAMFLSGPSQVNPGIWHNTVETFQVSLPTATGFPFCPVIEYPFLGDNTPRTLSCAIVQSSWSIGYVLVIIASLCLAILALQQLKRRRTEMEGRVYHQARVRNTTHLFMVITAILILIAYILSSGPNDQPGYHARYIISLIVLTPATIVFPLWTAVTRLQWASSWSKPGSYAGCLLLATMAVILVIGTVMTFLEVPKAQAANYKRQDLANHLIKLGATRIYTDYWTCNSLAFASKERILCAVVDKNMDGNHNRVKEFRAAVDQDGWNASWLCAKDLNLTMPQYNCLPKVEHWINTTAPGRFTRYEIDGYVLYMLKPQFHRPTPATK